MKKLILAAVAAASLAAVSAAVPASAATVLRVGPHGVAVGVTHHRHYHRRFYYDRFHHRHWR